LARAALAATAALRDAAVLLELAVPVVILRELLVVVVLRELVMLRELFVVMLRELLVVMLRELLVVEFAPAAGLRPTWGTAAVAGVRLPSVPFPPAVHLIYQRTIILIKNVKKNNKPRKRIHQCCGSTLVSNFYADSHPAFYLNADPDPNSEFSKKF
jgi:hypothetical protein